MNHTPDEKQLETMLENLVPTQTAHLEQRLAHAPWTRRGAARRRLVNTAAFAALAVAIFVAITPQGQAFAQNILQFFVRTESDTRAVPTLVSAAVVPGAPDEEVVNQFPDTRLPFEKTCGDIYHARCGLDEIRSMVSFPVKGFDAAANGLTFDGATGGPERVILAYTGEDVNGTLTITAEPTNGGNWQSQQVAASAEIEPVFINGASGEYVPGSWNAGWYSGDDGEGLSWTADPFVQTLRWEADGVLYTMVFHAGKDFGRQLDKQEMLALAEQMTTDVDALASIERLQPVEIEELSAQAGFTVAQPGWLPSEYAFLGAAYTPEQNAACLYYNFGEGILPVLAIVERPATGPLNLDDITISTVEIGNGKTITLPIIPEYLEIGGADGGQGTLITNAINASNFCPHEDFRANQAFYWQTGGIDYVIFGIQDQRQGGVFISRLELQALAENLTGVSTIPADQLDPERLLSMEDASALAEFELKTPTRVVAGLQFDHAVYQQGAVGSERANGDEENPVEVVTSIYTQPEQLTRGGIAFGLFISQASGALRSLDEIYNWGASETVTVNGQAGVYREYCSEAAMGGASCRQELYWDENGVGYSIVTSLPGALEREEFFAIAKSMEFVR